MDQAELHHRLCKLLPAQLDAVITRLGAPPEYLSGAQTPAAIRATELLQWAEQQDRTAELIRLVTESGRAESPLGPTPRRSLTIALAAFGLGVIAIAIAIMSSRAGRPPPPRPEPTVAPSAEAPTIGRPSVPSPRPPLLPPTDTSRVDHFVPRPSRTSKLVQFALSGASAYRKSEQFFAGVGPLRYTTFDLPPDAGSRRKHVCKAWFDLQSPAELRATLERQARRIGNDAILRQIDTDQKAVDLASRHPRLAQELIPRAEEWALLSDADKEVFDDWLRRCVATAQPLFNVTVANDSMKDDYISRVVYRVAKKGQVKGGDAGPILPHIRYAHRLTWSEGDQAVDIVPPFLIPAQSTASFEIELFTDEDTWGLCWLMKVFFVNPEGHSVSTEQFQLEMSGKPAPMSQKDE